MPPNTKMQWENILVHSRMEFVENFNLKQGQRVLVLCCGIGKEAFLIREKVGISGQVIGIDIDEEVIKKAREETKIKGYTNVDFIVKDASYLEEYFGLFDKVCCLFGIRYFNMGNILNHWSKCLKKNNGVVGIAAWLNSYPNKIIDSIRNISMSYINSSNNSNEYNKGTIDNEDLLLWSKIEQRSLEYNINFPDSMTYWNLQKNNDYYRRIMNEIKESNFKEMENDIKSFIQNTGNQPIEEIVKMKLIYASI